MHITAAKGTSKSWFTGINLSSAEAGTDTAGSIPGTYLKNYVYPDATVFYEFYGKKDGMNMYRIPILWVLSNISKKNKKIQILWACKITY